MLRIRPARRLDKALGHKNDNNGISLFCPAFFHLHKFFKIVVQDARVASFGFTGKRVVLGTTATIHSLCVTQHSRHTQKLTMNSVDTLSSMTSLLTMWNKLIFFLYIMLGKRAENFCAHERHKSQSGLQADLAMRHNALRKHLREWVS